MLIKLLKYEFRAAFRELITLYIALLGIPPCCARSISTLSPAH